MIRKSCILILFLFTLAGGLACAKEEKPETPIIHAGDWVSAWKTARESCPDATSINMFFIDRAGPRINAEKIFECVDIKALGELLVIIVASHPSKTGKSVEIVRACDVVRIEVQKSETGNWKSEIPDSLSH